MIRALPYHLLLGAMAAALPALLPLRAETLFAYGPSTDYVADDAPYQRQAKPVGDNGHVVAALFSDTAPLSPASGYTGPVFYGGYRFASSAFDAALSRQEVRNDVTSRSVTADTLYLQAWRKGGWPASELSLTAVYLFQQKDFAEAFRDGDLRVSGLGVQWQGYGSADPSGNPFEIIGRFLVRVGGAYYLSQTTMELKGTDGFTLSGDALARERWAPYDPAQGMDFDAMGAHFAELKLEGVTAAGIHITAPPWTGSDVNNAAFGLGIIAFEVSGGK